MPLIARPRGKAQVMHCAGPTLRQQSCRWADWQKQSNIANWASNLRSEVARLVTRHTLFLHRLALLSQATGGARRAEERISAAIELADRLNMLPLRAACTNDFPPVA